MLWDIFNLFQHTYTEQWCIYLCKLRADCLAYCRDPWWFECVYGPIIDQPSIHHQSFHCHNPDYLDVPNSMLWWSQQVLFHAECPFIKPVDNASCAKCLGNRRDLYHWTWSVGGRLSNLFDSLEGVWCCRVLWEVEIIDKGCWSCLPSLSWAMGAFCH